MAGAAVFYGAILLILATGSLRVVQGEDTTTTAAPTTTPEPPVTWFECPDQYSYHPSEQNCTQYLICVFGKAYLRACAGGLVWNDMLKICDWPNPRTTCQQIDDNTAYRPVNSPTVTDPPFPSTSDLQTNMYGGLDSSGLQSFKPDEDAAKSQLAQYAGKKVVYFDAPADDKQAGQPNDSTSSKQLQGQASQLNNAGSEQDSRSGNARSPSGSHRNTQDDVMPIGQIASSQGQPSKAPGKPLGMSSWDTNNDDFPSQQSKPDTSQGNDGQQASESQQAAPSPPKSKGPPKPAELPRGNPPPWIAMALAKKRAGGSPAAQLPPPPATPSQPDRSPWNSDDDSQQSSQYQQSAPPAQPEQQQQVHQQRPLARTPPPRMRPTFAPVPPTARPTPPRENYRAPPADSDSSDLKAAPQGYGSYPSYPGSESTKQSSYQGGAPRRAPSSAASGRQPSMPARPEPQSYQMPEGADDWSDASAGQIQSGASAKYGRPASPQAQQGQQSAAVNRRPSPPAKADASDGQSGEADHQPDRNSRRPASANNGRPMARPAQNQFQPSSSDSDRSSGSEDDRPNTPMNFGNRPPPSGKGQRVSSNQRPPSQPDRESDDSGTLSSLENPGFSQQQRQPSSDASSSQRQRFPGQRSPLARPQSSPWDSNVNSQFPLGSEDDDQKPLRSRTPSQNRRRPSQFSDATGSDANSAPNVPNAQFLFAGGDRQTSGGDDTSDQSDNTFSQSPTQQIARGKLDSFRSASAVSAPGVGRPAGPQRQQSGSSFSRKLPSQPQTSSDQFATGDRTIQQQINQLRQDAFPSFGDTDSDQQQQQGSNTDAGRQWSGFGDGQSAASDFSGERAGFSGMQQQMGSDGQQGPPRPRFSGDAHDDDHDQSAPSTFDAQRFYVGV